MLAPGGLEMNCINVDAVTLVLRDQLIACICKPKWADTNDITRIECSDPDRLCIDINVIRTAQISDAVAIPAHALQAGMITGDLRMIQDNCIIGKAPNGNNRGD